MRILFEDGEGVKTKIGTATNRQDAWKIIMGYLKEHGFTSHYQRVAMYPDEKRFWIDFGSHVSFMHVVDATDEEFKEFVEDVT